MNTVFVNILLLVACLAGVTLGQLKQYCDITGPCPCCPGPVICPQVEDPVKCLDDPDGVVYGNCCKACGAGFYVCEKLNPINP